MNLFCLDFGQFGVGCHNHQPWILIEQFIDAVFLIFYGLVLLTLDHCIIYFSEMHQYKFSLLWVVITVHDLSHLLFFFFFLTQVWEKLQQPVQVHLQPRPYREDFSNHFGRDQPLYQCNLGNWFLYDHLACICNLHQASSISYTRHVPFGGS